MQRLSYNIYVPWKPLRSTFVEKKNIYEIIFFLSSTDFISFKTVQFLSNFTSETKKQRKEDELYAENKISYTQKRR